MFASAVRLVVLASAFMSALAVSAQDPVDQGSAARDCQPPCRKGYVCQDGERVSACNPPCPMGYQCDPAAMDCVPLTPAPSAAPVRPTVSPVTPTRTLQPDGCNQGDVMFYGKCTDKDEVTSVGSVLFPLTLIPYAAASMYTSVFNIIWAAEGSSYDEYSYWNGSYYEYDYYGSYYDEEILAAVIPQTSGAALFGGLNQIAKAKQRRYLRELGSSEGTGSYVAGWILYGLSIVSGTLNIIMFCASETDAALATSIINSAIVVPSIAVNTANYCAQRAHLREAVKARASGGVVRESRIEAAPYFSVARGGARAGLAVGF